MIEDRWTQFPINASDLPLKLNELLRPIGSNSQTMVPVAAFFEDGPSGIHRQIIRHVTAVVPEQDVSNMGLLREAWEGLVARSTPVVDNKGELSGDRPSISGYKYIVAAWGDSLSFAFNLAEDVWMNLGLSPRCIGNDSQQLVYDDLAAPEFGIAGGEVTTEYYFQARRNVEWRIRNDYLRRYLWMRGSWAVRLLYFQSVVPDIPAYRSLMCGEKQKIIAPEGGWYDLNLQEHEGHLLMIVAACVPVAGPQLCKSKTAEGLRWPGFDQPITANLANSLIHGQDVFLDDRFLERYEQNDIFDSVPHWSDGRWYCSPSYGGQWGFRDCQRVGRNMLRVSIRDLYSGMPDAQIIHAHRHALSIEQAESRGLDGVPIVEKVRLLVHQLLELADNLAHLSSVLGLPDIHADSLFKISRSEIRAEGWRNYPAIRRLAQVAPMEMSQQAFLDRCKNLHELWQRLPSGVIRKIVAAAGYDAKDINGLKSLKLLQILQNTIEKLNQDEETASNFGASSDPDLLTRRNPKLSPLFILYDLRISDAHQIHGQTQSLLEKSGLDIAELQPGYGTAVDHIFDQVIEAFGQINKELGSLLSR